MTARVEELARQIASLKESDLKALLERVEELSFRHGLNALSDRLPRTSQGTERARRRDRRDPTEIAADPSGDRLS